MSCDYHLHTHKLTHIFGRNKWVTAIAISLKGRHRKTRKRTQNYVMTVQEKCMYFLEIFFSQTQKCIIKVMFLLLHRSWRVTLAHKVCCSQQHLQFFLVLIWSLETIILEAHLCHFSIMCYHLTSVCMELICHFLAHSYDQLLLSYSLFLLFQNAITQEPCAKFNFSRYVF